MVSLSQILAPGRTVLLIFSDPECHACKALSVKIAKWQSDLSELLGVVVVTRKGTRGSQKTPQPEFIRTLFQTNREVAGLYRVTYTPSAVLVNASGAIRSQLAVGSEAISQLVEHFRDRHEALGQAGQVPPLSPSIQALKSSGVVAMPGIRLPDLDGRVVDFSRFSGHAVLILFWNSRCSYCNKMLPSLRRWESEITDDLFKIVIIASGTAEQNRALGLRSPILLDSSFRIGSLFGATGTPSAALLDAEGKLVSPAVIGADNIRSLISSVQKSTVQT